MPNFDNIKPYADFAHEAAKHGGPTSYINKLIDAAVDAAGNHKFHSGYTKGFRKGSIITGIISVLGSGIVIFALDQHNKQKLRQEEEKRLALEANQAEMALREAVSQTETTDNPSIEE